MSSQARLVAWCCIGYLNAEWSPTPPVEYPFDLGAGVSLQPVEPWMQSNGILRYLGTVERAVVEERRRHVIVVRYEAPVISSANEEQHETEAKGKVFRAVAALWLSRASPAGVRLTLQLQHFDADEWLPRSIATNQRLRILTRDVGVHPTTDDLRKARDINVALSRSAGSVRVAGEMVLHAIHEAAWQLRYLLFWIALESLFAGENPAEARYRLNYRMALFLRGRGTEAQEFFRRGLRGYDLRSAIAHGLRDRDIGDSDAVMADVEDRVRDALSRILLDDALRRTFGSKERDDYLERLAFG